MFQLSRPLIIEVESVSEKLFKELLVKKYIKALVVSITNKIENFYEYLSIIKDTFCDKLIIISLENSFQYNQNFFNFIKLNKNGISTVKISIDIIFNKYYYKKDIEIINFFKYLIKNNINIVINIPIGYLKTGEVEPIFKILKDLNIYLINLTENPLIEIDFKQYKKFYKFFLKKVKKYKFELIGESPLLSLLEENSASICPAGRLSLFINKQGDIYSCKYIPISLGNLFKDTLEKVWISGEIDEIASFPEICKTCDFFHSCGGGCKARTYIRYKLFDFKDPLCPFH